MLADSSLDFCHHIGMLFQVKLGVLTALTDLGIVVSIPGTALIDNP